jgi:hypothetical protein
MITNHSNTREAIVKNTNGCPCGYCESYEFLGLDACMGCAGRVNRSETISECEMHPADLVDANLETYEQ